MAFSFGDVFCGITVVVPHAHICTEIKEQSQDIFVPIQCSKMQGSAPVNSTSVHIQPTIKKHQNDSRIEAHIFVSFWPTACM